MHFHCAVDEDNSGQLDFSEYVEALGKFCVLSKEDMLKCACHSLYDLAPCAWRLTRHCVHTCM